MSSRRQAMKAELPRPESFDQQARRVAPYRGSGRGRRAEGPAGRRVTGCLAEFRRDPLGLLLRSSREYGDLVRFRIGPVLAHLVNHPDFIQHVLIDQCARYDKQTRSVAKIRATCGTSLLTSDGADWLRQRRIVQPLFHARRLESMIPSIHETIAQRMEVWQDAADSGQPIEMVSEMLYLTLQVAARTLFGADVRRDAELVERSLDVILDDTWRRLQCAVDWSTLTPIFHRRRFREAIRDLEGVVHRLVAERRQDGRADDLLSALLRARDEQSGAQLDDREVRDAVITLLLAGHETTANALTWTFILLAQHAAVAESLDAEIQRVLGPADVDADKLSRLQFTDQVFAEAIRLYPSIWIMERRVVRDDVIDGVRIPAGSTLLISPFTLHRHAGYWPEPERFEPNRFAGVEMDHRPRLAYLPFGAGPHVCIGQVMAQLVARVTLATVFQRFRLALVDPERPAMKPGITLRHARPVMMTIARRV